MSFMDNYREVAFWVFNIQIGSLLLILVASFIGLVPWTIFTGRKPEGVEKDEFDEYVESNPEVRFRRAGADSLRRE